ncbi:hypothetical protein Trydic_g3204 [Trypoxylus dichotomus]
MSSIVKLLNHGLKTRPILTNAVIYGSMFVGAECLNQTLSRKILVEKLEPYDTANIGRCAIFGTFGQGPMMTVWYKWLDSTFPGIQPTTIVRKLIVDQMCFTPCLYVAFFVGSIKSSRARINTLPAHVERFPTSRHYMYGQMCILLRIRTTLMPSTIHRFVLVYVFHYTNCPEIVSGKERIWIEAESYGFATCADNLGRNQA